jgi:phospholipid-binding lipoprotein MlaA
LERIWKDDWPEHPCRAGKEPALDLTQDSSMNIIKPTIRIDERLAPPARVHVTRRPHRKSSLALLAAASILAGGCATVQKPDPLEPVNRKVFAFNEGLDKVVLQPAASAYKAVLPAPARTGVSNFFSNLTEPWSAFNLMLQGRFKDGVSDLGRFGTNTTVGVLGFVDFASDWGMPRHGEEFGRTLGTWGVGTGAYLVLPLFGPSDVRDAAALPIDSLGNPLGSIGDVPTRNTLTVLKAVDKRAKVLDAGRLVDEVSLDKYAFIRDAYLQRRRQ